MNTLLPNEGEKFEVEVTVLGKTKKGTVVATYKKKK